MNLKILTPTRIIADVEARKVSAESEHGSFCLEERHIDYAAILVPGILLYETPKGEEKYLAVHEGAIVKQGKTVLVSTREAIESKDLESLQQTVEEQFEVLDEREKKTQSAIARIEAGFVRRFFEMGRHG